MCFIPGNIIYNVTVKVEWSIHHDWLEWMKTEHMPEVAATGCFTHFHLVRLIESDDRDGPTYAAQYFALTKSDYDRYIDQYSVNLRNKAIELWGDQLVAFRTVMEIVH